MFGDNHEYISKLSILEGEGEHKMVRMANLAIVGSHKVCKVFDPSLATSLVLTTTGVFR